MVGRVRGRCSVRAIQALVLSLLMLVPVAARAGAPPFTQRGMYAHLHWSYNRPYALRSWTLDDWKRYVDLLAELGFNTLQIWPMMELLPHPLSAEDAAYLKQFAELIAYGHRTHHMTMWIGSCPNSITEDARETPIARREYFEFEKRLNPGDPAQLERLMTYRGDLYRTVPDADGYWVIDSDPGGWRDSPSSEFVDILIGHRRLIGQHGRRPSEQPLIYWIWFGWGRGERVEKWTATLDECIQRLPEPWRVHACMPEQLALCRQKGLIAKTTWFPYGLIEDEPAAPLTELRFDRIDASIAAAREAGVTSILGNAQTPLAQLPNLYHFVRRAQGDGRPAREILRELAGRLLTREAEVLARAWESLGAAQPDATLISRLEALAKDEAARGPLGRLLGEWQPRVLEDLAFLLRIRVSAAAFVKAAGDEREGDRLARALASYLQAVGSWLERTGYHNDRLVAYDGYRTQVAQALQALRTRMGDERFGRELSGPAVRLAETAQTSHLYPALLDSLAGKRK